MPAAVGFETSHARSLANCSTNCATSDGQSRLKQVKNWRIVGENSEAELGEEVDNFMALSHLAKSQLVKCHLDDTKPLRQLVKMSESVKLPSIEGMGAKLGEGM